MKSWRIPVYYDQQGLLTRRLGITQVPALVSQEGLRLRIDEWRSSMSPRATNRPRLVLLLGLVRAGPGLPPPPPAPASFPIRSPISAGPASCRSASAVRASPTSATRRTPTTPKPVCSCLVNPIVGLSIGFWEPARHVEVVRKPFCLVSLGGVDLDPGIPAPEAARFTRPEGDGDGGSFYQAHYYVNPVMYWLEVVTDFPCLEKAPSIWPT
jgi:conjugal transfer pilus assembly protein TraU